MQDSEKRVYYEIVTECWGIFSKAYPFSEFTDEWWDRLLDSFDAVRAKYAHTDYKELVDELTFQLQEEHERRQKHGEYSREKL